MAKKYKGELFNLFDVEYPDVATNSVEESEKDTGFFSITELDENSDGAEASEAKEEKELSGAQISLFDFEFSTDADISDPQPQQIKNETTEKSKPQKMRTWATKKASVAPTENDVPSAAEMRAKIDVDASAISGVEEDLDLEIIPENDEIEEIDVDNIGFEVTPLVTKQKEKRPSLKSFIQSINKNSKQSDAGVEAATEIGETEEASKTDREETFFVECNGQSSSFRNGKLVQEDDEANKDVAVEAFDLDSLTKEFDATEAETDEAEDADVDVKVQVDAFVATSEDVDVEFDAEAETEADSTVIEAEAIVFDNDTQAEDADVDAKVQVDAFVATSEDADVEFDAEAETEADATVIEAEVQAEENNEEENSSNDGYDFILDDDSLYYAPEFNSKDSEISQRVIRFDEIKNKAVLEDFETPYLVNTKGGERIRYRLSLPSTRNAKRNRLKRSVITWICTVLLAVLIAVTLRAFVFFIATVDGESMMPTLRGNQQLFVTKYDYWFTPIKHGDIVICRYGTEDYPDVYVKRVIAVGGETVCIRDGVVMVNGNPINEPYISEAPVKDLPSVFVPVGCVFVMGDNRNNSADSRLNQVGPIKESDVIGKVRFSVLPFGAISNGEV